MAEEDLGIDSFPDDIKEDVEGLIWLGHLEEEFEFCGHTFVMRTLKAEEEMNASLVAKEYFESLAQAKAQAWANIALSLVSVDGDEDFCPPIGPDKVAYARARFKWVVSKWYWPVGEFLFTKFTELAVRQLRAVEAVQDLSKGDLQAFTPSVDSSTDPGDSESPEILDLLD